MKRDYDVIIAGGGLAGTIAAQSVHKYSGGNLSILVIDRSPEQWQDLFRQRQVVLASTLNLQLA